MEENVLNPNGRKPPWDQVVFHQLSKPRESIAHVQHQQCVLLDLTLRFNQKNGLEDPRPPSHRFFVPSLLSWRVRHVLIVLSLWGFGLLLPWAECLLNSIE